MKRYIMEHQATTKAEAKEVCLDILQTKEKNLNFEIIKTKRGFSFLKSKGTMLRVSIAENSEISTSSVARGVIWSLLTRMGVEFEFEFEEIQEDILYISLQSSHSGELIGKQGRNLDSFQFIVTFLISRLIQLETRILIDINGYRKDSIEKLTSMAKRIAAEVAEKKKSFLLNSMSPHDRRIVHLTLEESHEVYTESRGEGIYKRVCILPK